MNWEALRCAVVFIGLDLPVPWFFLDSVDLSPFELLYFFFPVLTIVNCKWMYASWLKCCLNWSYLTALTPLSRSSIFFLKCSYLIRHFFTFALINLFFFLLISDLKINIDKVTRMRIFGSISYTNALKSTDLQGFW